MIEISSLANIPSLKFVMSPMVQSICFRKTTESQKQILIRGRFGKRHWGELKIASEAKWVGQKTLQNKE